jgi:transcriptional regulator with XRE-family HTH domain
MSDFGIKERARQLAFRCRQERKTRKMTIGQFAQKAGINPRTYSHFELTGEISLERLIRVFVVFNRATEIESLLRPSKTYATLDEMERQLALERGGRK